MFRTYGPCWVQFDLMVVHSDVTKYNRNSKCSQSQFPLENGTWTLRSSRIRNKKSKTQSKL